MSKVEQMIKILSMAIEETCLDFDFYEKLTPEEQKAFIERAKGLIEETYCS